MNTGRLTEDCLFIVSKSVSGMGEVAVEVPPQGFSFFFLNLCVGAVFVLTAGGEETDCSIQSGFQ